MAACLFPVAASEPEPEGGVALTAFSFSPSSQSRSRDAREDRITAFIRSSERAYAVSATAGRSKTLATPGCPVNGLSVNETVVGIEKDIAEERHVKNGKS
jgi:hypothetical protein